MRRWQTAIGECKTLKSGSQSESEANAKERLGLQRSERVPRGERGVVGWNAARVQAMYEVELYIVPGRM